MKFRRLFEKRNWIINSYGDETISSSITCYGNFFQMVYSLFRVNLKK